MASQLSYYTESRLLMAKPGDLTLICLNSIPASDGQTDGFGISKSLYADARKTDQVVESREAEEANFEL